MPVRDPSDEIESTIAQALSLLDQDKSDELIEFLDDLHPVDLVAVVNSVVNERRSLLLKHVTGLDNIAELITYANDTLRDEVLNLLDDARIAAVVRRQEVDDAAAVLSTLSRRRQISILRRLNPELVREITSLLSYDLETAGRIMTPLFVSFSGHEQCDEVVNTIREGLRSGSIPQDTSITYTYVVDDNDRLLGVISLRQLLTAPPGQLLSEIMETDIISVSPDDDQEDVARYIVDYDFACLPVVDTKDNKLLGIVTVDDALDVLEDEHTEDLLRLAGTEDKDTIGATVFTAVRSRLPWLIGSCLGGIGGAMLLSSFESILHKLVALTFFMPVVFGMGGNVGSQSSTITVRGIATGDMSSHKVFTRLKKEIAVGIVLGLTFCFMLGCASFALYGDAELSFIVGISILITMFCAASLGSMLPLLFQRLGFDPAVASGPFVTTTTDILSITIYFTVATLLLL